MVSVFTSIVEVLLCTRGFSEQPSAEPHCKVLSQKMLELKRGPKADMLRG